MLPQENDGLADVSQGSDGCAATQYRVWIARYEHWTPRNCRQVPPKAIAREPAEREAMSACQAARYAAAFNRAALARHRRLWAVALPVAVRFEGEPRPGEVLAGMGKRGTVCGVVGSRQ